MRSFLLACLTCVSAAGSVAGQATSEPQQILKVPAQVMAARLSTTVTPETPKMPKCSNRMVTLDVVIAEDGRVRNIKVLGGFEEFKQSAIVAVKQWIYKPYLENGSADWPDTLVNSKAVDYLIFKGSKGATRLQRIGIALFGVFFMLAGVAFIGIGRESHSVLWVVISLAWFLLGMRVLINAFRGAWSK